MFNNLSNLTFQCHKVTREERGAILGKYSQFRGCTIWFTGLSGSGKTTIAFALEKTLIKVLLINLINLIIIFLSLEFLVTL